MELDAVGSNIQGYDRGLQVAGETNMLARHKDGYKDNTYEVKVANGATDVIPSSDLGPPGMAW